MCGNISSEVLVNDNDLHDQGSSCNLLIDYSIDGVTLHTHTYIYIYRGRFE